MIHGLSSSRSVDRYKTEKRKSYRERPRPARGSLEDRKWLTWKDEQGFEFDTKEDTSLIYPQGITLTILLSILLSFQVAGIRADGTVTGRARFPKIKGHPAAGYQELYEWNLFLSRQGGAGVGPSRRLGAPPGQAPTHDGYYSITAPAGSYSILVNQPLFFARPKVVPDVQVENNLTRTLHIELAIDYSTYFTDTWALPWDSVWYQTFTATGTSITGVNWKLAGTSANQIRASVHRDNGNPNPATWPQVSAAAAKTVSAGALGDTWVRWRSGEVPTTPGDRYAIQLTGTSGGDRKFSPFNRNKDGNSYSGGQAYNSAGAAQNYDLNIVVFSDSDGTAVLYCKTTMGLGDLRDGYFDTRWGQTFQATAGTSLAAVDVWAAGADTWDLDFTWRIRKGGPAGPQVGPVKTTKAAYQAFGAGLHGVSYNPGEVPLEENETYYVEFTNPVGFNPYVFDSSADAYAGGAGYQNGALKSGGSVDVSMTILAYTGDGGTIQGDVTDAGSGRGIEGATVSILGLGREAVTGADGSYEIGEVPEGTYRLQADMAGYTSKSQSGVEVVAGEVARADFQLSRLPCNFQFRNEGFDSGLTGWTRYGGAKTSNPCGGWFGDIAPIQGSCFWGNEVNGSGLGTGGAYQRFCAEPGHRYRVAVWSNIYWIEGNSNMCRSRIGLHPAGGTESGPEVVFSNWDRQSSAATEGWRKIQVVARATGPVMTVFLEFEQTDAVPLGNQWRISCFDGVEIEDLDQDAGLPFERGDCRNDGELNLADPIHLIAYLFQAGPEPGCLSACDTDDNDNADLTDAILLLEYLFLGKAAPEDPHGVCQPDPTAGSLDCKEFDC